MENTRAIKSRVIRKINSLSKDRLKDVDDFIDSLKPKKKVDTMSFAGRFKDMGDDFFDELIDKLHARRRLDRNRSE